MSTTDLFYLSPVIGLVFLGLVMLIVGLIADRAPRGRLAHHLPPEGLALICITAPLMLSIAVLMWAVHRGPQAMFFTGGQGSNPLLVVDGFSAAIGVIATLGTLVVMLCSIEFFAKRRRHQAEYYSLLLLATGAVLLAASATDFLTIYLSVELLSLTSYVLAAYMKDDAKSSESGIKYFLFGAVSSAIMLYGISIVFGLTGSTNLAEIAHGLTVGSYGAAAWIAALFVLAGLGFKIALVPFHLWAPDVYEGAPTPVTAFLSVVSKAAGLAVLTRVLLVAFPEVGVDWFTLMAVLAAVSMTFGNLVAIPQRSIKRMLAYSSIAQVGYIMVGILAATRITGGFVSDGYAVAAGPNSFALTGLLIYIFSYLLMNLGAFAVVIAVEKKTGSDDIGNFNGLSRRAPLHAAALVVFFLSLVGIPPTAGFIGKLFIFGAAIQSAYPPLVWLAIIGVVNSVISLYYYFNVVRGMYFMKPETDEPIFSTPVLKIAIVGLLIATIAVCIFVQPVIDVAQGALSPYMQPLTILR